jgi:hypothetical protein
MKKKSYKTKNEDMFFAFLPEDVHKSLTPEQLTHYREYRRYHFFLFRSKTKVTKLEKQILKLKSQIKTEKSKWIDSTRVSEGEERLVDGWNTLLKKYYSSVSHLDRRFKLRTKVEKRNRTSRSTNVQQGKEKRFHLERISNTYKGLPLKERYVYYARVISVAERHDVAFHIGSEDSIRKALVPLFGEEVLTENIIRLKRRFTSLMVQYTRYTVFHHGWAELKSKKKNLQLLLDWVEFCDTNKIKREEWG